MAVLPNMYDTYNILIYIKPSTSAHVIIGIKCTLRALLYNILVLSLMYGTTLYYTTQGVIHIPHTQKSPIFGPPPVALRTFYLPPYAYVQKRLNPTHKISRTKVIYKVISMSCISDIAVWMKCNRLQLNSSKSEFIWFSSSRRVENLTAAPSSLVRMLSSLRTRSAILVFSSTETYQ